MLIISKNVVLFDQNIKDLSFFQKQTSAEKTKCDTYDSQNKYSRNFFLFHSELLLSEEYYNLKQNIIFSFCFFIDILWHNIF